MQNINEVFSDLDKRIDLLKAGLSIMEIDHSPNPNEKDFINEENLFSKIERSIIYFKKEALPRIEHTIKELNEINDRGVSIIKSARYFSDPDIDNEELKQEAYNNIKSEIDFYLKGLQELKASLEIEGLDQPEKYTISLSEDFKFPKKQILPKIDLALSRSQSALLFHYLMKKNMILNYDATSISKIISLLTGYPFESIRQKDFGHLHDIKKNVPTEPKRPVNTKTNLEILKQALLTVIQEIDEEKK